MSEEDLKQELIEQGIAISDKDLEVKVVAAQKRIDERENEKNFVVMLKELP